MDIDRIPKTSVQTNIQPVYVNQMNMIIPQQNYNVGSWNNGKGVNTFETVEMQQQSARF